MPNTKVTRVCSATNILLKYNWHLNSTDDESDLDLGLQSAKKYWRCTAQVADELSHLQDFLPAFTIFVNKAYIDYKQKIQLDKCLRFRRDKNHKWGFLLFIKLYISIQYWKIDRKDIANTSKLVKEFLHCSLEWSGLSSNAWRDHTWLERDESDEKSLWRCKMMGKLLLTVIVADLQQLDQKEKPIMYIRAFVKIYNWHYRGQIYETYGMVELEKYPISKAKNPLNLGSQQFYKISKILQSAYVVPRDTEGNISYLNNYINKDLFNQLYDPEWQTKRTRFANIIVQNLMLMSRKWME